MSNNIQILQPTRFVNELNIPQSSSAVGAEFIGSLRENDGLERWDGTAWSKVSAADVFVNYRGTYSTTATYYYGDIVTYGGSSWWWNNRTPGGAEEPSLVAADWKLLAQRGDPGTGAAVRIIYYKSTDPNNAPAINTADSTVQTGWSLTMPQIDTYWLLATSQGDYITTISGSQYLTTVDGEYIWASNEVLNPDGTFNSWSAPTRITGRNGIPNEYTEFRFALSNSSSVYPPVNKTQPIPDGWGIEQPAAAQGQYVYMIKANKLPNGTLVSAWSTPIRVSGVDGAAVSQGAPGPFMQYRGLFDPSAVYHGDQNHIDAVQYNGNYYVTSTTVMGDIPAGTLPTDTTYWNVFSGQFESVATGLLLAQLAYITNLGVRYVRTADAGQRIVIDGAADNLIFYDSLGREVFRIDGNIDTGQAGNPLGGAKATDPVRSRVTYNSGNGLFSNAGGMQFLSATTGIPTNASMVGILADRNANNNGIAAAVVGIDTTTPAAGDTSESWGGYFSSLKVSGPVSMPALMSVSAMALKSKQVSADYTCDDTDYAIMCYNSAVINVTLPANPANGRMIVIRRVNTSGVAVVGDGTHQILAASGAVNSYGIPNPRNTVAFQWDGQYWQAYNWS